MIDPNRNPVVWCVMGYLATALLALLIGILSQVWWIQIIGGSMLALLLTAAVLVIFYLVYDLMRSQSGRRRR